MITTFLRTFSAALIGIAFAASAVGQVLDFQSLENANDAVNFHGHSYSEDGFTIEGFGPNELATAGTSNFRYTGSTALLNDSIGGLIRLTMTGGGLFALNAIDLAELNGPYVTSVTFDAYVGVTLLGSETFWLDGNAFAPETFSFGAAFSSVDRVEWHQVGAFHQFDNVVLNADSNPNNSVPDSASTFALVGLALAGVAWMRRSVRA